MKIRSFFLLLPLAALSFACERIDVAPATANQAPTVLASGNQSLADFVNSLEDADDVNFVRNTAITDHSQLGVKPFEDRIASGVEYPAKASIKIKWHGINGSSCKKFPGLCIIIPIGSRNTDFVDVEALADLNDNRLYLYFPAGSGYEPGLTSEGYMPIGADIPIPDDVLKDLGISNLRTTIKASIYTATYDAKEGRYVGIVVDLVEQL